MKTIFLSVLLAVVLSIGNVVKANDFTGYTPIEYSVYTLKNQLTFRLTVSNEELQTVTISIYNEKDNLVHYEQVKQSGTFTKSYDMSILGAGVYKVAIATKGFKTIEVVKVGLQTTVEIMKKSQITQADLDFYTEIEKNALKSVETNLSNTKSTDLLDLIEGNSKSRE
jgi:hypothetical protein